MKTIRGMTWNHTRGFAPLEATAKAFHSTHKNVEILWEKRTLSDFGHFPLEKLTSSYDLLIIDHPFMGNAASGGYLLPIDGIVPPEFLASQGEQSVGQSNSSYIFDGHQWALAIDAACQASAYRRDLLSDVPPDWESVLKIAEDYSANQKARIGMPLNEIDSFCVFVTMCANAGSPPFCDPWRVVDMPSGVRVLSFLRRLLKFLHPSSLSSNPPKMLDLMSQTDELAYIPLTFGYSNYSRRGYSTNLVLFTNIPSSGYGPIGSILGGAGLAISAGCRNIAAVREYAMWIASPQVQRSLYFTSGGQPGNRVAWLDRGVNRQSSNFFLDTWKTITNAYLRPRYDGFIRVQKEGGKLIYRFLSEGGDPRDVLSKLNRLYSPSRT